MKCMDMFNSNINIIIHFTRSLHFTDATEGSINKLLSSNPKSGLNIGSPYGDGSLCHPQ